MFKTTAQFKYCLSFLCILLATCMSSFVQAADLSAYVDKNVVQVGQFIQFSLTLSDKSSSQDPDFSSLSQDFDILSSTSKSSQTQIINGSMSSSTTWSITISPKHEGAIVIPPIKLAGLETKPITVVVGKAPQTDYSDAYFDTNISSREVYVQAELKLDLKLYIRMAQLSNTQLDELTIPDAKVVSGGDAQQSQITKNGIRYYLIEKSYFIFPEKSGSLKVPALSFNGIVTEGSRFSSFGNRRRIFARSESFNIKVDPIPESYPKNAVWLPAEQVILAETFSPGDSANVGEPLTRSIVTKATGLSAATLPPIELKDIKDLKLYPDQGTTNDTVEQNHIVSTRNDSFALISNKPGDIDLPTYKLPWWDTKANKLRYAELKSKTLHFTGTAIANDSDRTDSTNSKTEDNSNKSASDALLPNNNNRMLWIVGSGFLLLWITTIIGFVFYIRSGKKKQSSSKVKDKDKVDEDSFSLANTEKEALNQFSKACNANNGQHTRLAIINWAQLHFPNENIEGLSRLSALIEKNSIDHQKQLINLLNELDKQLYTNSDGNIHIDFKLLKQSFNEWLKQSTKSKQKEESKGKKLSSLYKQD